MRKISFILMAMLVLAPSIVYSQTPTKTAVLKATPTAPRADITAGPTVAPTKSPNGIDTLKENIEKKVNQISKKQTQAVYGVVKEVNDKSLTLTATDNKSYQVTLDETISSVYETDSSGDLTKLAIEDIVKDAVITVSGPIIENQVTANVVYIEEEYIIGQGSVTETDKAALTITVVTSDKENMTLDIETGTTQQMLDTKTLKTIKGGFSKFQVGDTIHFVVLKKADAKTKAYSTLRTFLIPQEYFVTAEK